MRGTASSASDAMRQQSELTHGHVRAEGLDQYAEGERLERRWYAG